MKKVEYRVVDSNVYNKCLNLANELLNQISAQSQIPVSKIFPKDIILYFESNYDINFSFFESKKNEIIYKDLVQNPDFIILDDSLVNRTSGLTMPKKERALIFINQSMPLTRIKFTILHELTHLHFHKLEDNKKVFTSKFSGKYSDDVLPFEDEANIIASLLFCSTPKLEMLLTRNYSFDKIKSITGMSIKGLHSRLLNYLHHILGLSNSKALELVLKLRDNDYKTTIEIKHLVNNKNNQLRKHKIMLIKISRGFVIEQNACVSFLKNLSMNELINELEYAHSTKNTVLEQLVMNEYYQKQQ
ncbi:ImmA/IrrE family metallo-endopeptidase [Lactococcus lactis]|uniref:ImmA/IrrE family metallo-endopeptidase n=1 Tax=Lactococcus lactis TaxID=1358 RepID=UPI00117BC52B|nr:ImmA/IrrE family metallo-endopeptidase [Lactococcus lactis]MCX7530982.1 ImmA/IrrE family metallo-endopeptidase [Lactococcus lactis]MDM7474146.1 ImmA/IrrE family metallo-endopeptidase [Lactococcus lactis]TRW75128.1 ImmA/IrrE family metallo-endopeptidase [Lactococcus lactis]